VLARLLDTLANEYYLAMSIKKGTLYWLLARLPDILASEYCLAMLLIKIAVVTAVIVPIFVKSIILVGFRPR